MECLKMSVEEKSNDLPLVSNVNDILVDHYIFNFVCSFHDKSFNCFAVLFLKPVIDLNKSNLSVCACKLATSHVKNCDEIKEKSSDNFGFILVLDCHKIIVDSVEEISTENEHLSKYTRAKHTFSKNSCKLNFIADEWSLKVWKNAKTCKICFPKAIKISYRTTHDGPSLLWVTDQEKNPAVFTYGAWINNRSLFPCQEPPVAMATWEAVVSVDNSCYVVMSGDEEPIIDYDGDHANFYYYTKSVMPMSTLCLAIGFWENHVISSTLCKTPKCRIFAPPSLLDKAIQEFFEYIPCCLKVSVELLGIYPFGRIDFLVVPPTFGSLGMASPHVVFLSQSLIVGDGSMCSRVAHEIAHGWFGLLIGASDWTEEWLSEGFATFVEDFLHVQTLNMRDFDQDYREIKAFIRKKTLLEELNNTEEEMQMLRPAQGKTYIEKIDGIDAPVLKNGQNPIKAFVQVHYIKGYFLLKNFCDKVGVEPFFKFLQSYIEKFKGCLVSSKEFLSLFMTTFPSVQNKTTLEEICDEWLNNPGVAQELINMKPSDDNALVLFVEKEIKKWRKLNHSFQHKTKRRKTMLEFFSPLTSEQTILLLENLLEVKKLSTKLLADLNDFFRFEALNPEIQHRWFELVVKLKYEAAYDALKVFLLNHLAMGVYLYGELLYSGDEKQQTIAKQCYEASKTEMEPNYICTIDEMLKNSMEK